MNKKIFYTFENYTFESVVVSAHTLCVYEKCHFSGIVICYIMVMVTLFSKMFKKYCFSFRNMVHPAISPLYYSAAG